MLARIGHLKSGRKLEQGDFFMKNHPVFFTEHTDKFIVDDNDMDSDTDAESDMSLLSRSFLHRVDDRVRKIQDQHPKDATQDSIKHSFICGMFMSSTLEASVFMEKNYLENFHFIKNTGKDLTMRQMFDISEKLIAEQSDRSMELIQFIGVIHHGSIYLWLVAKKWSSLSRAKVYVFSDSLLCFGKIARTHYRILSGRTSWRGSKVHQNTELWTQIDGEPIEFEWNISHAALQQSPRVPVKNERTTRRCHRTDDLHVDVQRHPMGISRK